MKTRFKVPRNGNYMVLIPSTEPMGYSVDSMAYMREDEDREVPTHAYVVYVMKYPGDREGSR